MHHEHAFRALDDTELADQITRLEHRIQALRLGETAIAAHLLATYRDALSEAQRERQRRQA